MSQKEKDKLSSTLATHVYKAQIGVVFLDAA